MKYNAIFVKRQREEASAVKNEYIKNNIKEALLSTEIHTKNKFKRFVYVILNTLRSLLQLICILIIFSLIGLTIYYYVYLREKMPAEELVNQIFDTLRNIF